MLVALFVIVGCFVESFLLASYEERSLDLAENSRYKILTETGPSMVRECLDSRHSDREETLRVSLASCFYDEDVVVFRPDGSVMFTTGDEAPEVALEDPEKNRWLPLVVRNAEDEVLATLVVLDRSPWSESGAWPQFLVHLREFVTGDLDNSFGRFHFFASVIAALASTGTFLFFLRWVRAFRRLRRAAAKGRRLRDERRALEADLETAKESLNHATGPEERVALQEKVRGLRLGIEMATERALRNDAYRAALDGADLRGRIEAEVRLTGHCTFNAMILGREMDAQVRRRMREAGIEETGSTMFDRLRALQQRTGISDVDFDRLQRAWKVRNRIIHNQHEAERDEGLLLARSLRILNALSSEEIQQRPP